MNLNMNSIEIPPFYVGQEVVANCNHEAFKKGQEFIIRSIRKNCCGYVVTIGIKIPEPFDKEYQNCSICNKLYPTKGIDWEFRADRFSPKIEISKFISMKELAEKQLELIGAN